MIAIDKKNERFVYASFRERYYSANCTQEHFTNFEYTSVTGYEQYDATALVGPQKKSCLVEFKVRDFESKKYDTALIEEKKFMALMNLYYRTGKPPIYYCFYTDGIMLAFNLLQHQEVERVETTTNKYTVDPSAGKIKKYIYNLPISKALKMSYSVPTDEEIRREFYSQFTVV